MRTSAALHIAGIVIFSLIAGIMLPDQSPAQDRLELIHADELRNTQENGKNIQILDGAVQFRRGEYDMFCDHAVRYEATDVSIFTGNVRVFGAQDTLTSDTLTLYNTRNLLFAEGNAHLRSGNRSLHGNRIRYFTEKDVASAAGNVTLQEEGQRVTADSVWYNEATRDAEIYGSSESPASVYDPSRQIRITGPVITQNLRTESLKAIRRPILTKLDSTGQDVVRIIGNTITGNPDSGSYVAQEQVVITRDSMRAETELATFREEQEEAVLEQSPVVFYTENTIRGETIHLYFHDDKVRQVYIPSDAEVRSVSKGYVNRRISVTADTTDTLAAPTDSVRTVRDTISQENVIRGTQLRMWLEDNKIRRTRVSGMATSTYHVFDDSVYQGINETSGDTIILSFSSLGDSLQQIDVIGGTRGTFKPHRSNTSVDTTIYYEADHIVFQVPERITNLKYEADARYQGMELEAGLIDVFWNRNLLIATPLPDSVDAERYQRNVPLFTQRGQEPMSGDTLMYNIKTQRGRVIQGQTKFEDGFYTGKKIMKRGEKTLYVNSGIYTTCDLDWPHYHFQSDRMKMIVQDLVVARPIVMYIHDVPVFGLPFAVFPQKSGRRNSGYILPTWGESSRSGRYLKGLGFYWAPSDYWDYRVQLDFWEKRGISVRQRLRYNKRYSFNGNIGFNYDKEIFRAARTENYQISVTHNQTIDPTMDLRVNGRYVSSSQFLRETSLDRQDRLRQQIVSNATLNKRWEGTKNSMSVNLQRTENLQNGNITETLPQLSFRRGTDKLLKAPALANYETKNKWFYNINYSYNSNFRNRHEHRLITGSTYIDPYGRQIDLGADSTYIDEYQRGVQHSLSFSNPRKILSYFSFNPSLNVSEDWVPAYREPVVVNDTVQVDSSGNVQFRKITQFRARHTYNFSFGTSTKLYGLFQIPFGPVTAVRHVMTPNVSYNIGPDFSDRFYDYYFYGTMPDSSVRKFDRFRGTAVGGTRASERQSLSISLRNVFQAKYLSGGSRSDTAATENKVDFLTWNISTGYNFVAEEKPWNQISSSLRASLGRKLSLDVSMRHDPYQYDSNELAAFPRMTNLSLSTGFNLSGRSFKQVTAQDSAAIDTAMTDTTGLGAFSAQNQMSDAMIPSASQSFGTGSNQFWSVRLSFRYSINKNNPNVEPEPTFWMNTNTELNLSKNWSVSVSSRFDMAKRELVSTDFTIRRDLHCWEMYFTWTPTGYGRGYYLKINVKSPSLQDVKVESRGGRSNRYGY
ncbi:MAG: hypothetical protein K9N46_12265 [Candidatus Marinimicrobia bacterium]|nr:hypothetical protein [Candidatus Neomarinimicrobiota bacterium]MCF7829096.1 hypothetical protein [Candidatus Neomarinimicrobiota bacterium]MCF7881505.1 hypothetical protein [Candidatus Neomarinimicrobiota bacterium]